MAYSFQNLVFEGGGVKGIAYVGAMQVLDAKGILSNIKRVGGTSAGAINAVLVGLNYTANDTLQLLKSMDFKSFMDDDWGIVRDTARLINQFGWYKGNSFRDWIADVIAKKTGNSEATFNDVFQMKDAQGFRDLYFIGTNLSTGFSEVFSVEHTPRMCVADAARISMSIPLFFASIRSPRGDVYVDGGVLDNYPIRLFDRQKYVAENFVIPPDYQQHNQDLTQQGLSISPYVYNQETLGFRLDSAQEIAMYRDHAEPPERKINDFFDYAWALVETIMNTQDSYHLESDDWQRTVYIDTLGVGTTDFGLSDQKKDELVQSGIDNTKKYFDWYDDPKNHPVNRPT
ncbi:MAG TPA: patatin-like phospholipase family protein [Verrucomicrobiae bacterium]|nr:patatin-like phospholipase family protein [Verrucomicrobiae bacterium]